MKSFRYLKNSLLLAVFTSILVFANTTFPLALEAPTPPTPPEAPQPPDLDQQTQRVIVKFKAYTPNLARKYLHNSLGASEIESLYPDRTIIVHAPKGMEELYAKHYNNSFWVDFAEPDAIATNNAIPNDTFYSEQWGLDTVDAPEAWDIATGQSIDIAILDSGIAKDHPDIAEKVTKTYNFTWTASTDDLSGHGTHVAGIAAALTDNNQGVAGVSPNARLMSGKVLDDRGRGYYSWIVNGIYWAVDNGAEIINLSLGGSAPSFTLEKALDYAHENNVIVVAAAGNRDSSWPHYPAYYDTVVAVGATDSDDQKSHFSNYGDWVDIVAPGEVILSTFLNNEFAYYSGTSMATPFVSGALANLLSVNPEMTPTEALDLLYDNTDQIAGTGEYWRTGRLNIFKALDAYNEQPLVSPSPSPTLLPTSTPDTFSFTYTNTSSYSASHTNSISTTNHHSYTNTKPNPHSISNASTNTKTLVV